MPITRKAVLLIAIIGIGVLAGLLLEPRFTRTLMYPADPARTAHDHTPAGETGPRSLYQRATQGSARDKGLFLDNLLLALNTYGKPGAVNGNYLDDFSAVFATLAVLLQDDSEYVAEPAAAIINVLALMEHTTGIKPVSGSATIRQALENVIAQGTHDSVRGRAIDASVLMYPPDDAMVGSLEEILLGDMDRYPESHAAAFRALGIYKRRYNYPLPETTMATAKQLLEHPSQAVRVKAEFALAELAGPSVLPTLIAQLKQAGNSSEGLMLTALILRLDNSQDTIDQLTRITADAQR